jgi:hypothetical protein
MYLQKKKKRKNFEKELFFVGILSATDKKAGSGAGVESVSVSHYSVVRIRESGSGSIPKCQGSTTLERMKEKM